MGAAVSTPDNREFIVGLDNGIIQVLDSRSLEIKATLKGYGVAEKSKELFGIDGRTTPVRQLSLSQDGLWLGVAYSNFGLSRATEIWKKDSGQWMIKHQFRNFDDVQISRDGTRAIVFEKKGLKVVDLASGEVTLWTQESHPKVKGLAIEISNAAFLDSKGETLFVFGFPASALVSGRDLKVIHVEELILFRHASGIAQSADLKLLALPNPLTFSQAHPSIYEVASALKVAAEPKGQIQRGDIWKLMFSPNGEKLAAMTDSDLSIFSVSDSKEIAYRWADNEGIGNIHEVNFLDNSKVMITTDEGLYSWKNNEKPLPLFTPADHGSVTHSVLSSDGKTALVSTRHNGTEKVVHLLLGLAE